MVKVLTCGFLIADIVVAGLNKVADPGEVIFVPKGVRVSVGGHPANIAIDLVKLGMPPNDIGVSGAIGDDIFGDFIEHTLESHGIRLFLQKIKDGTDKNVILVVKDEDRRFHIELSASQRYSPSLILELIEKLRPRLFYLASGILDLVDKNVATIFRKAKELGAITFADVIKPYGKGWDYIIPAMHYIDVFHCNDLEARGIVKAINLEEAIDSLMNLGAKLIFITMGERGAIGASKSLRVYQRAFKVDVVDPTGAGDAFCAGIIYKLIEMGFTRDKEIVDMEEDYVKKIMLYAQAVGASACTAPGTTRGVSKEKVRRLIDEQGEEILSRSIVSRLSTSYTQ